MSKTLMLAKPYNEKALKENLYFVSEKLDGMPVVIYGPGHGDKSFTAWTRQGKQVTSIPHIIEQLKERQFLQRHILCTGTFDFVCGELYIPGKAHKDVRGLAMRQESCEELCLYVFPPFMVENPTNHVVNLPAMVLTGEKLKEFDPFTEFVHGQIGTELEGFIAYNMREPWVPGKRSSQYMKILKQHTVDLRVVDVFEAVSKEGEPLGRVGAFLCEWAGDTTKVGAGKLSHKQAEELWQNQNCKNKIIEVKYKKDVSYNRLREPTFQQFREDKDEYDKSFFDTAKL